MKLSEVLKGEKIKFVKVGNKKYYSIVSVLDQLEVSTRLRKYWYDAKKKIEKKDKKILEAIKDLKVEASDGKQRILDCASKTDLEKILKEIPSKKVKVLFENKKKDSSKKITKKDGVNKKQVKKDIKKTAKKQVKKEVKKETKKVLKKVPTKKIEKKENKIKKEAKKAIKKEVKKVIKNIDKEKITKKAKDKDLLKKTIKKEVTKKIKKDVKKKKCGIICNIIKIFA